jgi:phenylacetic acid degradation operon negative regulatory protein
MGAINDAPAERWTLLTFSMPEGFRRKRYDLRARLSWAGFGPLQHGAWLAPSEVDVRPIVDALQLAQHVRAFRVSPIEPTNATEVIASTFDLDALAVRYRAFCRHWEPHAARATLDPLQLTLRLSTEWLRIIRDDPRVPVHLLPPHWPAIEAQRLFRSLHGSHRKVSEALANKLLDTAAPKR